MKIEYKHVPLAKARLIKAKAGTDMVIDFYVATTSRNNDTPDFYNDVIRPGAFRNTVERSGAARPMLRDHDMTLLIGAATELHEDDYGLLARGIFVPGVQISEETFKLASAGVLTGASIGYRIPPGGSHFEKDVRVVTEIDFIECSLTAFPANTFARIVETSDDEDEKNLRALTEALANRTTAIAIETAFAKIRQDMKGRIAL